MSLLTEEERVQFEAKKTRDAVLKQRFDRLKVTAPDEPAPRDLSLAVLESVRETLELDGRVKRRKLGRV